MTNVEFLASTDPWFRPVNFYIGPDGAIYLLDYYRLVIEHPEWMATKTYHSPDLYKGADLGRIYRITPSSPMPLPGNIRLGEAADQELVKQLENPNIWWRRTAQRLLVDRQSEGAAGPLVRLFETSTSAAGRLHALWTLDGLHKLDSALVAKALGDAEPGFGKTRSYWPRAASPATRRSQTGCCRWRAMRIRGCNFSFCARLGGIDTPASRAAQERLLVKNIENPWMQIAALTASSDRAPAWFKAAAQFTDRNTPGRTSFFRQVASVIGARRKPAEIRAVLEAVSRVSGPDASWWRAASLEGLSQGLGGGGGRGGRGGPSTIRENVGQDLMLQLFDSSDEAVRRASLRLLSTAGLPPNAANARKKAAA